jgi:hypothetical protein
MCLSIAFKKQWWYSTDTTLSNWSVGGAAPRRWARSSVLKWNSFKRKTSPFNDLMNRANKQQSHLVFILVNLKNVQTMTAKQIQHARTKDVLFPNCLQNNPSCADGFLLCWNINRKYAHLRCSHFTFGNAKDSQIALAMEYLCSNLKSLNTQKTTIRCWHWIIRCRHGNLTDGYASNLM